MYFANRLVFFLPGKVLHIMAQTVCIFPGYKKDLVMARIATYIYLLLLFSLPLFSQTTGTLRGKVTLDTSGQAIHQVTVTIMQLKRIAVTDDNGAYEFKDVPPGKYDIKAHLDLAPDVIKTVQVTAGNAVTADLQIKLTGVKDEITITASGNEESTFNSIQSVTSVGALELLQKNSTSLGEALDHESGIAKRSNGPGSSRPVVRGFDGDRVLVLQDGMQLGALGSQSSDHAEPIDLLALDKIEVVKGPATLLYGSSAIGGVVNAISSHDAAHKGVHGYLTGIGSTNTKQASGSGGIEFGTDNWLFWGNASGSHADDYHSPLGLVKNSYAVNADGSGGVGYFGKRAYFSSSYDYAQQRYGVPVDTREADPELVYLNMRRHSGVVNFGWHDPFSFAKEAKFFTQYNDYEHREINGETGEVNTTFKNKTFVYRGMVEQKKVGRLSGSSGFWGLHRDYQSVGEEALTPPVKQNSFAAFTLQTLDFKRASLQLGGRLEHNGYDPTGLQPRSFTGFSGAVGVRVPLWEGGAFVANYSHSFRAPALEELYNHGPHGGNLTFEIGNFNLKPERNNGIDLSVRHSTARVRAEVNYFYYHINDFVFLAPTGARDTASNLLIANYAQGTSRYTGVEARFDVALHSNLWLNTSVDYVKAELIQNNTPLPRIPPLRGRIGLDATYKSFNLRPEVIFSDSQTRLFPTETKTDGYVTVGLTASYTIATQHLAQIISVNASNLGNELYRNHLSFLKDFAPEIGRGVRVSYTLRFF